MSSRKVFLGLFIRRCEGDGMKMLVCVCFLCERLRERAFNVTSESQLTRAVSGFRFQIHLFRFLCNYMSLLILC
jgi:hypothetical protein